MGIPRRVVLIFERVAWESGIQESNIHSFPISFCVCINVAFGLDLIYQLSVLEVSIIYRTDKATFMSSDHYYTSHNTASSPPSK